MKIAIIGAGISGLTAAYYLHKQHDITVYESADKIGGHTATVDVEVDGITHAIDTGFIVYNDWTYPKFIELLDELNVSRQITEMSFSVRCDNTGIEYGGNNVNTLFAQRLNLLRPGFLRMVRDILRFNREAVLDLDSSDISEQIKLGEYLALKGYGREFTERYLLPMGCAIWSSTTSRMLEFPLLFFVRFFKNHGLLSINNRPRWHVIKGGSKQYLKPLTRGFRDSIITGARITSVNRQNNRVLLTMHDGASHSYDQVIMACHSDQALALLKDASRHETDILGAIPYQPNEVILHTDSSLLPRKKLAWSSWNYRLRDEQQEKPILTYDMNILQGISAAKTICVSLNAGNVIQQEKVLRRFEYSHPVFSMASVAALKRKAEINGVNDIWFAGAYWGNGFHEDGVLSGRQVADAINERSVSSKVVPLFPDQNRVAHA